MAQRDRRVKEVLKGRGDTPDWMDSWDCLALPEGRDLKEDQEHRGFQDPKVPQDLKETKETKETLVRNLFIVHNITVKM